MGKVRPLLREQVPSLHHSRASRCWVLGGGGEVSDPGREGKAFGENACTTPTGQRLSCRSTVDVIVQEMREVEAVPVLQEPGVAVHVIVELVNYEVHLVRGMETRFEL